MRPNDFKSPPPEPRKTDVQLVQDLDAIKVYCIGYRKRMPLKEALDSAWNGIDVQTATPALILKEYGIPDLIPALESLQMALGKLLDGTATPDDRNILIQQTSRVFRAMMHNAYNSADYWRTPANEAPNESSGPFGPTNAEKFDDHLKAGQDWKMAAIEAERIIEQLKRVPPHK